MKYKMNPNLVVDKMDGIFILTLKDKNEEIDYNHAIVLEDVAQYIFTLLLQEKSEESIINQLIKEYDVKEETAKKDFENFINQLIEAGILT